MFSSEWFIFIFFRNFKFNIFNKISKNSKVLYAFPFFQIFCSWNCSLEGKNAFSRNNDWLMTFLEHVFQVLHGNACHVESVNSNAVTNRPIRTSPQIKSFCSFHPAAIVEITDFSHPTFRIKKKTIVLKEKICKCNDFVLYILFSKDFSWKHLKDILNQRWYYLLWKM